MARRGQGLPLNLIVLAAIAAIVLVLIVAFTIGGSGAFLAKLIQGGESAIGDDIATERQSCQTLCSQATLASTTSAWKSSAYCTQTANIDYDNDGNLGCPDDTCVSADYNAAGQKEVGLSCYGPELAVACSTTIGGQPVSAAAC